MSHIDDDMGEAFVVAMHRCGAFLNVTATTYHDLVPITLLPGATNRGKTVISAKPTVDRGEERTALGR